MFKEFSGVWIMAYTTIDDPSAYFKVQLFTGTGSSNAVTFNDTDTNMQPDLVWIKSRNDTNEHYVSDSVRGTGKEIYTSLANAEVSDANGVTAFGSDGFTVGSGTGLNGSSDTNVAWCWKETADAGFDIVGYTGNATDDVDISHSLSAVPHVIIVKNRDNTNNESWAVYHHKNTSAPETDRLYLNTNGATGDDDEFWSDEVPTSSVFTIGRQDVINTSSGNHIAYLWSEKQGYSKFGSYTGNGNADGTFIYTGFRPAWIMIKNSGRASENWNIIDNKRDGYNGSNENLAPNLNGTESSGNNRWDILSNGFKCRDTNNEVNNSGDTYIYMAFAESPFVNSNGVPCNAR
jgi:hypothetical protein